MSKQEKTEEHDSFFFHHLLDVLPLEIHHLIVSFILKKKFNYFFSLNNFTFWKIILKLMEFNYNINDNFILTNLSKLFKTKFDKKDLFERLLKNNLQNSLQNYNLQNYNLQNMTNNIKVISPLVYANSIYSREYIDCYFNILMTDLFCNQLSITTKENILQQIGYQDSDLLLLKQENKEIYEIFKLEVLQNIKRNYWNKKLQQQIVKFNNNEFIKFTYNIFNQLYQNNLIKLNKLHECYFCLNCNSPTLPKSSSNDNVLNKIICKVKIKSIGPYYNYNLLICDKAFNFIGNVALSINENHNFYIFKDKDENYITNENLKVIYLSTIKGSELINLKYESLLNEDNLFYKEMKDSLIEEYCFTIYSQNNLQNNNSQQIESIINITPSFKLNHYNFCIENNLIKKLPPFPTLDYLNKSDELFKNSIYKRQQLFNNLHKSCSNCKESLTTKIMENVLTISYSPIKKEENFFNVYKKEQKEFKEIIIIKERNGINIPFFLNEENGLHLVDINYNNNCNYCNDDIVVKNNLQFKRINYTFSRNFEELCYYIYSLQKDTSKKIFLITNNNLNYLFKTNMSIINYLKLNNILQQQLHDQFEQIKIPKFTIQQFKMSARKFIFRPEDYISMVGYEILLFDNLKNLNNIHITKKIINNNDFEKEEKFLYKIINLVNYLIKKIKQLLRDKNYLLQISFKKNKIFNELNILDKGILLKTLNYLTQIYNFNLQFKYDNNLYFELFNEIQKYISQSKFRINNITTIKVFFIVIYSFIIYLKFLPHFSEFLYLKLKLVISKEERKDYACEVDCKDILQNLQNLTINFNEKEILKQTNILNSFYNNYKTNTFKQSIILLFTKIKKYEKIKQLESYMINTLQNIKKLNLSILFCKIIYFENKFVYQNIETNEIYKNLQFKVSFKLNYDKIKHLGNKIKYLEMKLKLLTNEEINNCLQNQSITIKLENDNNLTLNIHKELLINLKTIENKQLTSQISNVYIFNQ